MGLRVRLTPRASADLDDIRTYLTAKNLQGAERVRERIAQTIALLAEYPGIGRPTDFPGVSVIPVARYPYLVYHMVLGDQLVIIHQRHAARDAHQTEDM